MAGCYLLAPEWSGKIVGDDGHDRIAACLVLSFQKAPGWCKVALSHIDDVISGSCEDWKMGMNAFMLHVRRETTDISPVYEETGDPTITVQTADLRKALVAWCKQISKETD